MKNLYATFLVLCILLSSCMSQEMQEIAPTIIQVSDAPSSTNTPTSTATLQPTSTQTPTLTPTLTPTPDVYSLGNPPQKKNFVYPEWLSRNHFSYDEENYFVFSKQLHGTDVIVVIHKDNNQGDNYHQKFAEFVWDTFHLNWGVFQGYPYSTYYVKVLSPKSNQDFASAIAIGFVVVTNPQKSNIGSSWYSNPSEYRQIVTHEMFHAWNGEIIADVGNHINYVRPEFWFLEGATHYYGYRGTPNDIAFYNMRFNDSWQRYRDWRKTKYNVPVVDLSKMEVTTGEWQYGQMIRENGACLFYLMDKELISMGMSLDDLMRYMYENFGLTGKRYRTDDILAAINTITNSDWSEFFNKYVYGNDPLPLDGRFEYLEH